ncbi:MULTISPECIES: hypothetical protein [unclassified Oceanobacillus]|nr:hypothetical protein [Oceanobacillus sp. AG]
MPQDGIQQKPGEDDLTLTNMGVMAYQLTKYIIEIILVVLISY